MQFKVLGEKYTEPPSQPFPCPLFPLPASLPLCFSLPPRAPLHHLQRLVPSLAGQESTCALCNCVMTIHLIIFALLLNRTVPARKTPSLLLLQAKQIPASESQPSAKLAFPCLSRQGNKILFSVFLFCLVGFC